MENPQQHGCQMATDAGDGAQDIFGLQFAVNCLDLERQLVPSEHVDLHDINLDADLGLQFSKVEMIAMKGKGFPGGLAEPFDKRINKGTAMRMISAGMQGNEACDRRPSRLEDYLRIDPMLQKRHGEPGAEVWQHALEKRGCPSNEIEKPTLG